MSMTYYEITGKTLDNPVFNDENILYRVLEGGKTISATVVDVELEVTAGVTSGTMVTGENGFEQLSDGGVASGTTAYDGGGIYVTDGGTAINAKIASGGWLDVDAGGSSVDATLYSGGSMHVWVGGTAIGTKVCSGATQIVDCGGIIRNTILYAGGIQKLADGADVSGNTKNGGTGPTFESGDAGTASGGSTGSQTSPATGDASVQIVKNGGTAVKTKVTKGCKLVVSNGGLASAINVATGGTATILGGGTLRTASVAGTLTASAGAKVSAVTLKSGAKMSIATGNTLAGKNSFAGAAVTGGTAKKAVKLARNASLVVGAKTNMKSFHLNASNASLSFTGAGSTLGSLTLNAGTKFAYNVSKLKAKGNTLMLSLSSKNSKNLGKFAVTVAKGQAIGTYELSKNLVQKKGMGYVVSIGSKKLGVAKLNDGVLAKNGVTYSVKFTKNQVSLVLGMKEGKMFKSPAKGTANSDIFYGGKANSTIKPVNGRDVVVYDKTAWGKDKIVKTGGTMTLLFKDLKKADVVQKLKGTTMTLTRKGVKDQSVTVQGWNAGTHNVVFGGTMKAFAKWLKASKPTVAQTTAARNEAWKKAKLAQA